MKKVIISATTSDVHQDNINIEQKFIQYVSNNCGNSCSEKKDENHKGLFNTQKTIIINK